VFIYQNKNKTKSQPDHNKSKQKKRKEKLGLNLLSLCVLICSLTMFLFGFCFEHGHLSFDVHCTKYSKNTAIKKTTQFLYINCILVINFAIRDRRIKV